MAAVWRCERCGRPLGEVGDDGRLRWYDEAVAMAAGGERADGSRTRLVVCRHCGRVNPFRTDAPAQSSESVDRAQDV